MNAQVPLPDATAVPEECRHDGRALRTRRRFFGFGRRSDRSIRAFIKGRSAATAVEFGLIAVPFMAMMLEILQNAFFVYVSGALDQATVAAARQIMTGSVQNQSLTAAQFRTQILCPMLPLTMSCNNVIVNIQNYSESSGFTSFLNAAQTSIVVPPLNNTKTSFCPGGTGQYVYVQVFYAMPLLIAAWLPVVTTTYNGATVRLVSAAAAFKNEPFTATSNPTYPGC
jgi:Flp pilus assembly protein TadG